MKHTYMAPMVEEVRINGVVLLGVSGEGGGGVLEPDAPALPSSPDLF